MTGRNKTLEDLLVETLEDVHHAEQQILRTLPRMAKATQSDDLRQALEQHREGPRARSSASRRPSRS